jgi:hypothetical protein
MAITWGAAVADSSNAFRIGYEISQSPATVVNGTSSVTITLSIYLGTQYYANDSSVSWNIAGDIVASGAVPFDHNSSTAWSSSNVTLLATRTKTVTPSFTGTVVTNGTATVTGLVAIAGTASVSWSKTTAQRPVGVPAAPGTPTATRVSDTQHTVAWTNTSPTSVSNPYTNVVVQRSTDGGAYTTIATLGVVTSYSDKTTSANHRYTWRVYAKNGAGNSAVTAASNQLKTTPAAPGKPTATKGTTNITLAWTNPTWQADNIEVWHAANGVWDGAALTTLAASATSYTHVSPNAAQTHQYRLRSKTTTPALNSVYSTASDVVQLQAPPNAPTLLSPASVARDLAAATVLTWKHNPVDTTVQRLYEVQHRVVGAGSWTSTGQVTSSTSSHTLAAGTYANGQQIEWQVRSWGAHATASPWSATAVITGSTPPETTVTSPTATHNSSTLTASWSFFDAEGGVQSGWELELLDGAGTIIEEHIGAGTTGTLTLDTRIADGGSYTFRARTQDSSGLWGAWDEVPFTVTYAVPEVPTLTLAWDESVEGVYVTITNPPTTVGKVDAVSNQVWRSIDGGVWHLVAEGVELDATVLDPIPSIPGSNAYRVVAVSALPSTVSSDTGERPELLTNTSFEVDTTGWAATRGTVATVANALAVDGVNVAEYTSTDGTVVGGNYLISNLIAGAVVGRTYRGEGWVGVPVGSTLPQMRVSLQFLLGGVQVGSITGGTAATLTPGDSLQRVDVEAVCPATANQVRLLVYAVGAAIPVGGKMIVDALTLKELPPPNTPPTISNSGPADAVVVNAGEGFGEAVKLRYNIKAAFAGELVKVLQEYADRTSPVEDAGVHTRRTVTLSVDLVPSFGDPAFEQLWELHRLHAPACYRDPDGRRWFVSTGPPQVSDGGARKQGASMTLTEVHHREPTEASQA